LVVRSIVAILLLIGFYALALGVAGGLLWVVYAQVVYAHRVFLKLVLICVVLAGLIVWSVLPRPDKFEPPGPRLSEEEQPRLFALVRDIGARTGQAMPREVYLVADVNAFVTQRGGIMGFFSKRVMGLGLPLLSLLTVSELRAVIAHEFGHYYGGDTKLGPWIYKTRGAITRTVISLTQGADGWGALISVPFKWYLEFFLRITQSISRAQEFAADALAAKVVGQAPLISGLKTVHGGAAAYEAYLQHELGPVLQAGFRPPLAEGFRAFVDGKRVKASLAKLVSKELAEGEGDAFDTHPPLAQRIAALAALPPSAEPSDDTPALDLLDDHDGAEASLIRLDQRLEPLPWSKVALRVLVPSWQKEAHRVAEQLGSPTLADLAMSRTQLGKLAARVLKRDLSEAPEAAAQIGASLCAAALSATLANAGWTVSSKVGRPVSLKNGEQRFSPFKDFAAVADGSLSADALGERLTELGVSTLPVHRAKS
jgi:Zn-dependent protease with chaperone function